MEQIVYTKRQAINFCIIRTAALKVKAKHKVRLRNELEDKLMWAAFFRLKMVKFSNFCMA